jgi:hypothetical protein
VSGPASVFLATADDIRDPAASWPSDLRRIAMIESKMGVDLKRGWIVRGRDLLGEERFQMYHRPTFVFVLTAPAKTGAPLCVCLDRSEVSAGRVCLALIDSCQQKMTAQNGFGQSWMSWPRCPRTRSRRRSMRATSRRREVADGTQRRSSGCVSASPKVHGAKPGSDLWMAAVRLIQPVPRHSEDPSGHETTACLPPDQYRRIHLTPPRFPPRPPRPPLDRVGARDQARQLPPDHPQRCLDGAAVCGAPLLLPP